MNPHYERIKTQMGSFSMHKSHKKSLFLDNICVRYTNIIIIMIIIILLLSILLLLIATRERETEAYETGGGTHRTWNWVSWNPPQLGLHAGTRACVGHALAVFLSCAEYKIVCAHLQLIQCMLAEISKSNCGVLVRERVIWSF